MKIIIKAVDVSIHFEEEIQINGRIVMEEPFAVDLGQSDFAV